MNKKSCICVLDSGIGGLPYLKSMRKELPGHHFCYVSDTAGFPYGEKSSSELLERLIKVVEWCCRNFELRACVIACNTASVTAIAALRLHFPDFPFIGVVPAVKPAAAASKKKRIAVLATRRTVEDPYLYDLISRYAVETEVHTIAAGDLVDFIEHKLYLPNPDLNCLVPFVEQVHEWDSDVIVLGCTHFLHIRDELARLSGDSITIIDSREGVTRQLKRIITASEPKTTGEEADSATHDRSLLSDWFTTAAFPSEARNRIADLFHLTYQEITI
ncbi:glutamate racemase [Spirochaeta dissipatitropha]